MTGPFPTDLAPALLIPSSSATPTDPLSADTDPPVIYIEPSLSARLLTSFKPMSG